VETGEDGDGGEAPLSSALTGSSPLQRTPGVGNRYYVHYQGQGSEVVGIVLVLIAEEMTRTWVCCIGGMMVVVYEWYDGCGMMDGCGK
jgi:hypothetical protein